MLTITQAQYEYYHSSSKTDLQAVNYVVNASVQSSIQVLYMGHSRL